MLYQAGCHCNISYNIATSIPVRRRTTGFRGLQDAFGAFPGGSPITPAHSGLRVSGIALEPSAASPSSSGKPDFPSDHFPLDTCLAVWYLLFSFYASFPPPQNKPENDLKLEIVPQAFF